MVRVAGLLAIVYPACGRDCSAPPLPIDNLLALKRSVVSTSGPRGALVIPNPIDASRIAAVTASDSRLARVTGSFTLPGLINPNRLANDFLKVMIQNLNDSESSLAKPNYGGEFRYPLTDVHYSEVMAYFSLSLIQRYVETLGFSIVKSRPLYVMVRAESEDPNLVNAIYDHNYLDPSLPRTIRMFGNTDFAPAVDRDMFWHEFGHLFNESVSREVGFDFATDNGAVFTEGGALHECLADALAESVGDKPDIGKWVARNFSDIAPGMPLRSAVDRDQPLTFDSVITATGPSGIPEKYAVAEWCSRVLWAIRSEFMKDDENAGPMDYERLVFTAVSLLPRDASLVTFRDALREADQRLHCGDHEDAIVESFSARGFSDSMLSLSEPLRITVEPAGLVSSDDGSLYPTSVGPGKTVAFTVSITNPGAVTARNVRLMLESGDSRSLHPTTYLQGYGDLPGRQTIVVGGRGGLDFSFSVMGEIDSAARSGQRIRYRIRALSENGPPAVFEGELAI